VQFIALHSEINIQQTSLLLLLLLVVVVVVVVVHTVRRGVYRVLVTRPGGQDHFEELGIDGRIILKWIFKERNGRPEVDLSG
jgi:hypothetical protein